MSAMVPMTGFLQRLEFIVWPQSAGRTGGGGAVADVRADIKGAVKEQQNSRKDRRKARIENCNETMRSTEGECRCRAGPRGDFAHNKEDGTTG